MVDVNGNVVLTKAASEASPALVPSPAVNVSLAPVAAPPVQAQANTSTVEANLLPVPIAYQPSVADHLM